MTPTKVDRSKELLDMLRDLPVMRKGLKHKDPARRALHLSVNLPEASYMTGMDVDPKIGRALLLVVRTMAIKELKEMGIKIPKRLMK